MKISTALIVFASLLGFVLTQVLPGPYPSPLRDRNSFQGLGPGVTCNDSFHLITNYWWQVLLQKQQQYKVIKDHLHPLVISPELNALAFNHSLYDMAALNTVNSRGYLTRRAIIEQHPEWLTRTDLSPDPKYPPLGITSIDEIYGAGDNPSAAWKYILDYAQDIIKNKNHTFIGVGVYCQPKPGQSYGQNQAAYWWVTLILVGTCSPSSGEMYFRNESNPESNYICCNLNSTMYGQCLSNVGLDSTVTLYVNSTSGPQAVCCDFIELNANNSVPRQNNSYTGTAIATTYIGQNEESTCFCVSHDAPTANQPENATVPNRVSSAQIHFGRRGIATDGAPIFTFSTMNIRNQNFRECWNYVNDGLCFENIASGNLYIELETPVTAPSSLIRGQLQCEINNYIGP